MSLLFTYMHAQKKVIRNQSLCDLFIVIANVDLRVEGVDFFEFIPIKLLNYFLPTTPITVKFIL